MDNLEIKLQENLLWLSGGILSISAYFIDIKYAIILFFWIIVIISGGNAKGIHFHNHPILTTTIRRILSAIPYLLPLLIGFRLNIKGDNLLIWCLLGFMSGLLLIVPKYKEWGIALSIVAFTRKRQKIEYFTQILLLLGIAISEEIFFRNFIIGFVDKKLYIFSVVLSCGLFFLSLFCIQWSKKFRRNDYIIQVIFALISGILFIMSDSIIPSIIANITYKSPQMILAIKSYFYHYKLAEDH